RLGKEIAQSLVDAHEQRKACGEIPVDATRLAGLPARVGSCSQSAEDLARLRIGQLPLPEEPDRGARHRLRLVRGDLRDVGDGRRARDLLQHAKSPFWRNISLEMPYGNATGSTAAGRIHCDAARLFAQPPQRSTAAPGRVGEQSPSVTQV